MSDDQQDRSLRTRSLRIGVGLAVVVLIGAASTIFTVREGEAVVVTRFGRPLGVIDAAGPHAKLPWPFEQTHRIDIRRQIHDTRFVETLTQDKRNIVLLTYVVWSVSDPLRFLRAVGSQASAKAIIDGMVTNAKNALLGQYPLSALVSTDPSQLKLETLEARLLDSAKSRAQRYGITVHQVGLKRLGLPEENVRMVFDQMRHERTKEAARYRAEGRKKALDIRSAADLRVARIRARAERKAQQIRGEAEAKAASVYAKAHEKAPAFYRFRRSLTSLKKILGARSTLILRADRPPFDLLTKTGTRRK